MGGNSALPPYRNADSYVTRDCGGEPSKGQKRGVCHEICGGTLYGKNRYLGRGGDARDKSAVSECKI